MEALSEFIVFIWNTLHRFTFGALSEFLVSGCHRFPLPWMAPQLPCYKGWEPWARVGFPWHRSCWVFNHSHEKNNWSSQCALFTEILIFTPNHLTNLRKIHFFRWFPLPFPMTFAVWDGNRPNKKKYYLKLALIIYQSNTGLYLNMSHSRLDQLEIKCFKWMHYHLTVDQTSS